MTFQTNFYPTGDSVVFMSVRDKISKYVSLLFTINSLKVISVLILNAIMIKQPILKSLI
jgi:hypothetical protein